jgi:hypothetical protein
MSVDPSPTILKPALDGYDAWLAKTFPDEDTIDATYRRYYETVALTAEAAIRDSAWYSGTAATLRDWDAEYQLDTGYPLLANPPGCPALHRKSWQSFRLKTFRKNVLNNSDWPDAPRGGWILPSNWFTEIHDVVRTTVIVKYLDGVEFLSGRMRDHGVPDSFSLCDLTFEARSEGYYAAHVSLRREIEIPNLKFDTRIELMALEIQIATQLQDVIRRLTHTYYESRRERPPDPDVNWQWQYRSDEFIPNYLGHILHYVEGMIMEVRDRGTTGRSLE